jgi:amino acid adenylation domain-containing protein
MAYVIYTSGSTGQPKGVMIDHRGAVNTVACINQRFSITTADRIFAVSSLSFDLSVYDVFGTLAAGAAIVLPAPSEAPSPALWLQRMRQHGVSVWNSAPALMEMLQGYVAGRAEGLPATLRLVMLSGDWIPVSLPGQIRRQLANVQVMSLGGATEASIWSIFYPIGEVAPGWASIPYGRPMLNQRFHVLDGAMEPAPVGVVGELYIGGIGVALGYLGRPSLTAERFLPDPFAAPEEGPGARLYRTGDLGRYLTGGEIEFLGRADHQVKVRGFRIEVGEIEAQFLQHRDVREAVVTVRDDLPGGRQLIGYYTGAESGPPAPDVLRRHLRQALPEHMIPAFLVPLEALPLTPNGKVDRRALPAPAVTKDGQTAAGPATPSEEILAAIWSEILGLERIGAGDNFFELGGHSLTATQVASRIRESVGVDFSLRQIFEALTLRELAERLDVSLRAGGVHQLEEIALVSRAAALPLSFAQERLWFAEQLAAGASAYNMAVALEIHGALDRTVLAAAAAEIVRRHESLRTRFLTADAGPLQVIEPRVPLAVPLVDLSGLTEAAREGELRRLSGEAARYPYDLAVAPLLQTWLLRLGSAEHRLLISMHHIVSDGWSMGVFLRELCQLYGDIAAAGSPSLPPLPIQYADFAAWQRRWLQGEELESLLGYWRQRLAGAPEVLALPTDRPRPAVRSLRGANWSRLLPPDLRAGLKDLSRRCGATLFMTVLAAFKVLLSRYSGQLDILVGTDIAGRNRRELEGLIGFFVNHPVLRTDLSGNPTFAELLDRVRRVTLEAYAHQDLPFEKLVEELQPQRDLSRAPLFQILFVLQNVSLATLRTPDLAFTPLAVDSGRCKFDLILMMWELEDGLQEVWTYSTDLFAEATIARMSGHLEALLRQIVARPEARLSDLEMLTAQEKEQQTMEREQRQSLEANTLRRSRRRAVDLASLSPIALRTIAGGDTRCLVVEPAREDVDLIEWIRAEPDFLESNLREYGAVLFRGFPIGNAAEFERFAQAVCPELFGDYGDLPRAGLEGKVYTSTPYPADQWILYHNESSHLDRWPLKQFFHCIQPAERGGETPLADCRRVYERLDPEIRRAFAEHGVMYVRNFTPGIDVSWQEFFHTDDRREVETACRAAGLDIEWKEDGSLRTRKVCPAVARHPRTGEDIFFNQIQAHHVFCVSPEIRESLLALFPEESLPRNVYFGDGSPIADSVMQRIIDVYHQVAVRFAWQKGDILVVDNMLVAHSRAPFAGERKIVVTMGEMVAHEVL